MPLVVRSPQSPPVWDDSLVSGVAHDLGSLGEDAPNLDLPDIFLTVTLGIQVLVIQTSPFGEKRSKIIEINFMPLPKATEKSHPPPAPRHVPDTPTPVISRSSI